MLRAYKYRIYPNENQKELFAKTFGCVRFVYNWGLNIKKELWENEKQSISKFALINKMKAELKIQNDWLSEVNSQSLQIAIGNLDTAFQNFFRKTGKYPKFKKKTDRQSFQNPQHCSYDFKDGVITIPKAKNIKIVFHRKFTGDLRSITISKECDNTYYASLLVEDNIVCLPKREIEENTTIGIDTGLKTFAVCSNGIEFSNEHFSKKEAKRLRHYQRMLKRKQKPDRKKDISASASYEKVKQHISKIHQKVKNRRNDYLNKITYNLTHDSQVETICVEDLSIRGMIRNKHLSYNIADCSIGEFYRKLEYKCEWYGINFQKIGRFEPSSKQCNVCGNVNHGLKLSDRHWTCPKCKTELDRDFNASLNIKKFGLRTLLSEREEVKPVDCSLVDDRKKKFLPKKQRQDETGKVIGFNSLEATKSLA